MSFYKIEKINYPNDILGTIVDCFDYTRNKNNLIFLLHINIQII